MDNHDYCCDMMADSIDGEDKIIEYIPKFREYGIPIHDGGTSKIQIHFCPWCGKHLPASLRDTWFKEIRKLGIENPWDDARRIPKKFRSDTWWREK